MINSVGKKEYQVQIANITNKTPNGLSYALDYNLKDFEIVIGSGFRIARDSLVAHGELNPPYTDTEEYKELLKSKILYWKDGKWVKREELE